MIEWTDEGIVLLSRPHGETAVVVSVLTRKHGRHAGLVMGGQSRRIAPLLQPGQRVQATWRARLADQLGQYALESSAPYPAHVLEDPAALAGMTSACAIADAALPEREAYAGVYEGLLALVDTLRSPVWPYAYVRWELGLLREIGYGIDLSSCAVTGQVDSLQAPLRYVSPRTGRAVCEAGADPYREKLLPLPAFLCGRGEFTAQALQQGLALTGFFLERRLFALHHAPLPAARRRLAERLTSDALVAA